MQIDESMNTSTRCALVDGDDGNPEIQATTATARPYAFALIQHQNHICIKHHQQRKNKSLPTIIACLWVLWQYPK
jgi:hypothetical protein